MQDKSQVAKLKKIFLISLLDCRYRITDNGVERYQEPHTLVTNKKSRAEKIVNIAKAYGIHYTIHELLFWADFTLSIHSTIGEYYHNPAFGTSVTYDEKEQYFGRLKQ